MHFWLQTILVAIIVGACLGWVVWQAVRGLHGKRSRLGSCCAKGCSTPSAAPPSTKPAGERLQFIPLERLARRK